MSNYVLCTMNRSVPGQNNLRYNFQEKPIIILRLICKCLASLKSHYENEWPIHAYDQGKLGIYLHYFVFMVMCYFTQTHELQDEHKNLNFGEHKDEIEM